MCVPVFQRRVIKRSRAYPDTTDGECAGAAAGQRASEFDRLALLQSQAVGPLVELAAQTRVGGKGAIAAEAREGHLRG